MRRLLKTVNPNARWVVERIGGEMMKIRWVDEKGKSVHVKVLEVLDMSVLLSFSRAPQRVAVFLRCVCTVCREAKIKEGRVRFEMKTILCLNRHKFSKKVYSQDSHYSHNRIVFLFTPFVLPNFPEFVRIPLYFP